MEPKENTATIKTLPLVELADNLDDARDHLKKIEFILDQLFKFFEFEEPPKACELNNSSRKLIYQFKTVVKFLDIILDYKDLTDKVLTDVKSHMCGVHHEEELNGGGSE